MVSFDGTTQSAHTWPPLTLAQQPLAAMAEAAITDILSGSPPGHTLFDMDLVIGQSCGARRPGRQLPAHEHCGEPTCGWYVTSKVP